MTNKEYTEFVMLRGYNTNIVRKHNDNTFMMKFDDAFDRMLYCRVRGLEEECLQLYTKLNNKIKELNNE